MEEKKQKKIKASPRPRKLAGYMIGLKNVPGKTSLPRQGPCLDTRKEAKEDQGLTEAGENGRVHVEMEKGVLFSSLHPSLTDICLVGASISLRVRFFCRQF